MSQMALSLPQVGTAEEVGLVVCLVMEASEDDSVAERVMGELAREVVLLKMQPGLVQRRRRWIRQS